MNLCFCQSVHLVRTGDLRGAEDHKGQRTRITWNYDWFMDSKRASSYHGRLPKRGDWWFTRGQKKEKNEPGSQEYISN